MKTKHGLSASAVVGAVAIALAVSGCTATGTATADRHRTTYAEAIAMVRASQPASLTADETIPPDAELVDTSTTVNDQCVDEVDDSDLNMSARDTDKFCTVTIKTYEEDVPLTQDAGTSGVETASFSTGLTVTPVAAGTIYRRAWSQEAYAAGRVWQEIHKGEVYFDGSQVWSGTSYRGYKGWHKCGYGYRIGVDISNIRCSDSGKGTSLYVYDDFRISVGVKGGPISFTASQRGSFGRNG